MIRCAKQNFDTIITTYLMCKKKKERKEKGANRNLNKHFFQSFKQDAKEKGNFPFPFYASILIQNFLKVPL